MRELTLLNAQCGDVTLAWTPERDAEIEAKVADMMAKGWDFWLIEPRMGGLVPPTRTPLKEASAARLHRALAMSDETWDAMLSGAAKDGSITVVKAPDAPVATTRKAKTAKEVASGASVATPRRVGG